MSTNDDWWNSLSPDEQDQLLMQVMGEQPDPFTFGDTLGGDMSLASAGMPMQPGVAGFTTKGEVNPFDRTQEAGRVNLVQDLGALSLDNILSAYGGAGVYDPAAFEPSYELGNPINRPGEQRATAMAQRGGWSGYIARLMAQGLSAAEAEAKLYEFVEAPDDPSLTDQERAMKQSVVDSMPQWIERGGQNGPPTVGATEPTGRAKYDTGGIRDFAMKLEEDLLTDPAFEYQDPKTGLYYAQEPEIDKTPQMEFFDKYGIPYPTASYEDQDYIERFAQMDSGMDAEQRGAATDQFSAQQQARLAQAREAALSGKQSMAAASELEKAFADQSQWDKAPPRKAWGQPSTVEPRGPRAAMMEGFASPADVNYGTDNMGPLLRPNAILDQTAAQRDQNYGTDNMGPLTGGDPMLAAFRSQYDENYGTDNMAPLVPGTPAVTPRVRRPVFDFASALAPQAEMLAPETYVDRAGNRRPYTGRDEADVANPWTALDPLKLTPVKTQRATKGSVAKQREQAQAKSRQGSRAQHAAFQATYADPRLAMVAAMGRAYALAQAGQTPFQDVMAARNANAQRMLHG